MQYGRMQFENRAITQDKLQGLGTQPDNDDATTMVALVSDNKGWDGGGQPQATSSNAVSQVSQ